MFQTYLSEIRKKIDQRAKFFCFFGYMWMDIDGTTYGKKLLNIKHSLLSADIFLYRKLPLDVYFFFLLVSSACPLAACIIDEKQEAFS